MTKKQIKIFDYIDYKFFLKDYYLFQKKNSKKFSYRTFGKKAKVAPSLLKDIISGRRKLSYKILEKYSNAIGLSNKEKEYFMALVDFAHAKNNESKNNAFKKMLQLRKQTNLIYLEEKQYDFFSNWYFSAIRELITLPDFKEDYEWIARTIQPNITPFQAKKAIETLEQLGIIKRNQDGKLEVTQAIISSKPEMNSMLLRNFHSSMIQLAKEALERFVPEEREISSLTLGVSNECYKAIKERIRNFKEEILNMVIEDKSKSDTVCQVNFQLFPLIIKIKEDISNLENQNNG
jgi:uncharacterized protein (TIGR02147 family)